MTERVRWTCPGCHRTFAVRSITGLTLCPACTPKPSEPIRARSECSQCHKTFEMSAGSRSAVCAECAATRTGTNEERDYFTFSCAVCGAKLKAKARARGTTRQCPNCTQAIFVPELEDTKSRAPDPDAARSLNVLAAHAAALFQEVAAKAPQAALLVNSIFAFLPVEHQLPIVSPPCQPFVDKAWRICTEVRQIIARCGSDGQRVWAESIARTQVVMPDRNVGYRPAATARRKWSIKVRRHIWQRYGRRCYYCAVELQSWQGHFMHLDHLMPLVGSGRDEVSNLVPACPDCNLEKGGTVFPEVSTARPDDSDDD